MLRIGCSSEMAPGEIWFHNGITLGFTLEDWHAVDRVFARTYGGPGTR
jgi:hypothetical protein